jgi:membrane dipeptidase
MDFSRQARTFLVLTVLSLAACAPPRTGAPAGHDGAPRLQAPVESDRTVTAEAERIHADILTIDTHVDISARFANGVNPCQPTDRQVDLPKMEEGDVDAAFFIVYVGQGERTPAGYLDAKRTALDRFAAIHRMAEELCPDRIGLAYSTDDLERIAATGRRVAVIGMENGYMIGRDLSLVERYYDLGGRYLTLSHNGHNDISDSANPGEGEPGAEHGGLSEFGERVVREMNRLGMMVDVSHISGEAVLDAVRVSEAPVIASHSATQALTPIPRNLGDAQLRAIADGGGVVQVVALDQFVKLPAPEKEAALESLREELGITSYAAWRGLTDAERAEYRRRVEAIDERWPGGSVVDFVDHIDHAVELIGIDHVGIASDFDGGGGVRGWDSAAESPNVTAELVRRGYTEPEIRQLWGGNFMRVWRAVEGAADRPGPDQAGAGDPPLDFRWSDPGSPYLDSLRTRYRLDTLVAGGTGDYERARRVSAWVRQQFDHDGGNMPPAPDPISILEAAAGGERFRCVEYATVLAAALTSIGIPARELALKTEDSETRTSGAGHVVVEAWLPDRGKWMLLDGQHDVAVLRDGTPLSALELAESLERDEEIVVETTRGPATVQHWAPWVAPYLFYLDVPLDNRFGVEREPGRLMLVPSGAPEPEVFQGRFPLRDFRYTGDAALFYARPDSY